MPLIAPRQNLVARMKNAGYSFPLNPAVRSTTAPAMNIIETDRLALRCFTADDAAFIVELVNDPAWLQFIGDRGVRTLDDARAYITNGPVASYSRHGFGLYQVSRNSDGVALGLCGLLKREYLDDVDLGFAFLPQFGGQGYAREAAAATLAHARGTLGLKRIAAITDPQNIRSIHLLKKLDFRFDKMIRVKPDQPESSLFVSES